jgi:hypothetical protein
VNPDPDPGRPKLNSKKGKNQKNFMFDELLVMLEYSPAAKFIVPNWRDKVDSGIELSYGLPAM